MWVMVKVGLKVVRSPVAKVERTLDCKQSCVGRMERMWSPERTLNGWYEHNELLWFLHCHRPSAVICLVKQFAGGRVCDQAMDARPHTRHGTSVNSGMKYRLVYKIPEFGKPQELPTIINIKLNIMTTRSWSKINWQFVNCTKQNLPPSPVD